MTTLLHFKKLYLSAFEGLNNKVAAIILKAFSFFCLAGIATVIFAFVYRLVTGFAFQ